MVCLPGCTLFKVCRVGQHDEVVQNTSRQHLTTVETSRSAGLVRHRAVRHGHFLGGISEFHDNPQA